MSFSNIVMASKIIALSCRIAEEGLTMETNIQAGIWEARIRTKVDMNLTDCDMTKVQFDGRICSSPSDFKGCETKPS